MTGAAQDSGPIRRTGHNCMTLFGWIHSESFRKHRRDSNTFETGREMASGNETLRGHEAPASFLRKIKTASSSPLLVGDALKNLSEDISANRHSIGAKPWSSLERMSDANPKGETRTSA